MASPEEGEEIEGEGEAASLLPNAQGGRQREDEIRNKYRLRERNDRYSKMKPSRNVAGAVPGSSSTLPDAVSQVKQNQRKVIERGEKLAVVVQKTGTIKSGARNFADSGAQLALKYGKKKDKKTSAVQPPKQLTDDSTKRNKVTADQQQQQQQHYLRLRRSSPPTVSHSPSHTLRDDGTVTDDGSPTAPTSLLHNERDEALLLHNEVGEQITDGRSKGCCGCCRTM